MKYDAVVIGAGPNGLSAAIEMARHKKHVLLLEAKETLGGGVRTAELTLPGFLHDACSAIHPMAVLSPFFQSLNLEQWGVKWVEPPAALAHPLPGGEAVLLYKDVIRTSEQLASDAKRYRNMFEPFVKHHSALYANILKPIRFPRRPFLMAKFGWLALKSCISLTGHHFRETAARSLFAGCAAHSFVPLDAHGTASFALALAIAGHVVGWPFPEGGSQKIVDALASCLRSYGGEIQTNHMVQSMNDLPEARLYLFDVTPRQLVQIAGNSLPAPYVRKLMRFKYGPGSFKIDWALREPIPWRNPACAQAATVHVGGTIEDIALSEKLMAQGDHAEKPFVLLAQQSLFDRTRAPQGKHTAWAYCHVPNSSTLDMTERITQQIERFAPGFREIILKDHSFNTKQLEDHNPNFIGGDVSGGANHLQQILARPVMLKPYETPNPKILLCSSSTPPGGGVHGMCGYNAAQVALRKLKSR